MGVLRLRAKITRSAFYCFPLSPETPTLTDCVSSAYGQPIEHLHLLGCARRSIPRKPTELLFQGVYWAGSVFFFVHLLRARSQILGGFFSFITKGDRFRPCRGAASVYLGESLVCQQLFLKPLRPLDGLNVKHGLVSVVRNHFYRRSASDRDRHNHSFESGNLTAISPCGACRTFRSVFRIMVPYSPFFFTSIVNFPIFFVTARDAPLLFLLASAMAEDRLCRQSIFA